MVPARDRGRLQRGHERSGRPPGKLTRAAQALAYEWTGRADPAAVAALDDDTRRQFAALGIPAEALPGGDAPVEAAIEVWDVNWKAFCLFRACATQWHHIVLPGALLYAGLDYVAVEVVMRRLAPGADHDALFADVMWMEAHALPILNEVRA